MGPARVAWNAKVQKRVSTTSSVLGQIKAVKMMGLSTCVNELVQSLRVEEIESSKAFRMFFVWITFIGNPCTLRSDMGSLLTMTSSQSLGPTHAHYHHCSRCVLDQE